MRRLIAAIVVSLLAGTGIGVGVTRSAAPAIYTATITQRSVTAGSATLARFTVPVSGTYLVSSSILTSAYPDSASLWLQLETTTGTQLASAVASGADGDLTIQFSVPLRLLAGEHLRLVGTSSCSQTVVLGAWSPNRAYDWLRFVPL